MPAPTKKVARRDPTEPDELGLIVRFFASGGSDYQDIHTPSRLVEMVFFAGESLRGFWAEGRDAVRQVIPPRAYQLMDAEFSRDGEARQFEHWPPAVRRELEELLDDSDD